MNNDNNLDKKKKENNEITRKEAIMKMGKYAALTALGTFIILNPKKSQAQSLPPPENDDDIDDLLNNN